MGDQRRLGPNGFRELEDSDLREPEDHEPDNPEYEEQRKPKTIRNSDDVQVRAEATFEPLFDLDRHKRLLGDLDERGRSQRGKPRSHEPGKNPLGGRIFDVNCSWPMYRCPYKDRFRYV